MFGSGGKRKARRIEPRFDDSPRRRRRTARRPRGSAARPAPARKRQRQSRKARRGVRSSAALVYWTFVLAIWGVIGARRAVRLLRAASCRRSISSRSPSVRPTSQFSPRTARCSPIAATPAAPRSGSPNCRPTCPRRSSRSRTGASTSISASIPIGIAPRDVRDVAGGGGMQGGSTLTQQLAKNLFLTQERTLSRKIQEAILALWLERKYSKDQILELYLNRVYFGSGAYGVEAAAQKYFGKSAKHGHPVRGRGARRADEVADQARAQPQPEGRQRARRAGHHRHGRAGPHHRSDGQDGARQSRRRSSTKRARARSITPPTT